jgi:uncharacterized membrane protein
LASFVFLAVVVVGWVLIGPLAALVTASGANRRIRELTARIERLEAQLAAAFAGEVQPTKAIPTAAPRAPWGSAQPPTEPEAPEPVADIAPELIAAQGAPGEPPAGAIAPEPRESLETRIGARWSVLVGGLALALGAIFLVRYSIEAGLLGPATRIALGLLLSAVLFVFGEAIRRRDRALEVPILPQADVPAILTAAGGIAAFASIYAAHALYGFIGSAAAFVLLTAAGLATLVLSVIHGPALAALGALGSYAAPLLVASSDPKPLPVVLHTLAVTAAVLGMARIRGWRWLAVAGIVASLGWGLLVGQILDVNVTAAEMLLVAGLTAIFVGTLLAGTEAPALRDRAPDPYALAALAGVAALSLDYALVNPVYPPLVSGILIAGALGAVASRWTSAAPAALIGGVLAVLTVMLLEAPGGRTFPMTRIGTLEWRVLGDEGLPRFALKAAAIGLVIGLGSFFSADRAARRAPRTAGFFAAAGAGSPLLILVVVYLRHVPFQTRPAVGMAALVMAGIFAAMAERLIGRRPHDDVAPAPAFYAAGAVFALAFAMAVGLATRFVPLALSLGAAGVVWVSLYRPVRALPWLAVVSAALACVALLAGPPLTPEEIGRTPLLNGLVLRFGLPAAAVLFAGEMLRRARDDVPAGVLQAIGLALAALFVAFEIRHYANDGLLTAGVPGLGEQSALTLAALAFSLGLQRIAGRTASRVYDMASLVAGVVGAAAIAVAHFITANPLITGESVGTGSVFNLLLPGYLLPAFAAAWMATAARHARPRWYVLTFAALALALGFAYVTFMVRHGFQGPRLDRLAIRDAENWTYSAVWLFFGIALLAAGILIRSQIVRAASGLVIAAVVCKVFLFDMAALTGALRAASFLGLGAVLIVIGRLYQRLLTRGRSVSSPRVA